jgi:hypothetical protein
MITFASEGRFLHIDPIRDEVFVDWSDHPTESIIFGRTQICPRYKDIKLLYYTNRAMTDHYHQREANCQIILDRLEELGFEFNKSSCELFESIPF